MTTKTRMGLEELCTPETVAEAVDRVVKGKHLPGPDRITCSKFPAFWERHGDAIIASVLSRSYSPGEVRARGRKSEDAPLTFDQNLSDRVVSRLLLKPLYRGYEALLSPNVVGFWPGGNQTTRAQAAESFSRDLGPAGHVAVVSFQDFFELELRHDWLLGALAKRLDAGVVASIQALLGARVRGSPACESSIAAGLRRGESLSPALIQAAMLELWDPWISDLGQPWLRFQADLHVGFGTEEAGKLFNRLYFGMGELCQVRPSLLPVAQWREEVPRLLHIPAALWDRHAGLS